MTGKLMPAAAGRVDYFIALKLGILCPINIVAHRL
jgi:hypothetical protein